MFANDLDNSGVTVVLMN